MRIPWLVCEATAFAVVLASCSFPSDKPAPSCESNAEECPRSSKAATSVTCDCHCTVGLSDDTGQGYDGRVAVCLPPELNGVAAVGQVRSALSTLDTHDFDQRVFQYCSQDVARFLRTTIRAPVGLRACAVPLTCECTTKGAVHDSPVCHAPCEDVECTRQNCPAVLWNGANLDASACRCSRASACGAVAPVAERPGVCRDWLTPVSPRPGDDAGAT
jgi:hypothetical protein